MLNIAIHIIDTEFELPKSRLPETREHMFLGARQRRNLFPPKRDN